MQIWLKLQEMTLSQKRDLRKPQITLRVDIKVKVLQLGLRELQLRD